MAVRRGQRLSEAAHGDSVADVGAGPAVLVTGASKGIGEACVLLLAARGYRVFAGVRRKQDGEALQRAGGASITPVLLDVTDAAQIAAAAALVRDASAGGLYALVNNAGIAVAGPLEFLPPEELRRQLDVNVVGQIAVTQAFLPLLRAARADGADRRAGRIIFMSSVSGRSSLPFIGPYAASKFALEAAADALRVELRPFGMRVVLVEPGVILTPIWETSAARAREAIEHMPPEAHRYYGRTMTAVLGRIHGSMRGLPPQRVAAVVARALAAGRPRSRYVVGMDARARIALDALVPTRVRDWLVQQVISRM
jgi:NAD(P)-dependent dehydrogenase (short-subunit alcohol dehydrogenase family)